MLVHNQASACPVCTSHLSLAHQRALPIRPQDFYSDPEFFDCAPQKCKFSGRCVPSTSIINNGTTCIEGSEGVGCNICSIGFYRFRTECRICPKDKGKTIVVLVFLGAFIAYFGPTFSQLASPTVRTCLRNFLSHLQFLSIDINLNLHWPPAFLRVFERLKELLDGIQLAAPECVAANYNYDLYLSFVLYSFVAVFAFFGLVRRSAL